MTGTPAVSIIVPCFEQGRFLGEALDSVLAQTFDDWECIVVNDGSSDDTGDVARRYCERSPRFRLHEHPRNRGLSAARNAALDLARGETIQFLDADDLIPPTRLATMVAALRAAPGPAIAYSDYCFVTREPPPRRIERPHTRPTLDAACPLLDMARRWESELSIPVHAWLFDARLFRGIRFDERLATHEDFDCWMRILRLGPPIVQVRGELCVYRISPASVSHDLRRMRRGFLRACRTQLALSSRDPELARALREKKRAIRKYYRMRRLQRRWRALPDWVHTLLLERTHWRIAAAINRRVEF
jgi:glycosyltransferase involved in cell wall biosynthesis